MPGRRGGWVGFQKKRFLAGFYSFGVASEPMKTLRTAFKQDGFDFEQVAREKYVAVYRKTKQSATGTLIQGFEVIKIGRRNERQAFGKTLKACERFPSNDQWGSLGWTCTSKQAAFYKMNEWLN